MTTPDRRPMEPSPQSFSAWLAQHRRGDLDAETAAAPEAPSIIRGPAPS